MKTDVYKMGEVIKFVNAHPNINNKLGRFIDIYGGYPRVHLRKLHDTSNTLCWEDTFVVRWKNIVKVTGQLLFNFMY